MSGKKSNVGRLVAANEGPMTISIRGGDAWDGICVSRPGKKDLWVGHQHGNHLGDIVLDEGEKITEIGGFIHRKGAHYPGVLSSLKVKTTKGRLYDFKMKLWAGESKADGATFKGTPSNIIFYGTSHWTTGFGAAYRS